MPQPRNGARGKDGTSCPRLSAQWPRSANSAPVFKDNFRLAAIRSETNGGHPPETYPDTANSRSRYCPSRLISMNR